MPTTCSFASVLRSSLVYQSRVIYLFQCYVRGVEYIESIVAAQQKDFEMFDISYAQTRPDIWLLPIVDENQCSCGEDHFIEQWEIEPLFEGLLDSVPHAAVQAAIMFLWGYTQVCDLFLMNFDAAVLNVTGSLGGIYSKLYTLQL